MGRRSRPGSRLSRCLLAVSTVISSSCVEKVSDTLIASLCVVHTATVHVQLAHKQKSFA